jgi:hypothetical protein
MNTLATYRYRRWVRREATFARRDPDTMARHAQIETREPGSLRPAILRDRVGGPWWLLGMWGPLRNVETSTTCPRCGGLRGFSRWRGHTQTWTNPCGHRDQPRELITEADLMILGARVEANVQRILTQRGRSR